MYLADFLHCAFHCLAHYHWCSGIQWISTLHTVSGEEVNWKTSKKGHHLSALLFATQLSADWCGFPASTFKLIMGCIHYVRIQLTESFIYNMVQNTSFFFLTLFISIFDHYLNILFSFHCMGSLVFKKCEQWKTYFPNRYWSFNTYTPIRSNFNCLLQLNIYIYFCPFCSLL